VQKLSNCKFQNTFVTKTTKSGKDVFFSITSFAYQNHPMQTTPVVGGLIHWSVQLTPKSRWYSRPFAPPTLVAPLRSGCVYVNAFKRSLAVAIQMYFSGNLHKSICHNRFGSKDKRLKVLQTPGPPALNQHAIFMF